MNPPVIGIYSPSPGCGKTTIANSLIGHGYVVRPFAGPLKRVLHLVLSELGVSYTDCDRYIRTHKEDIIPQVGTSARQMLRTLGTEWGRQCVHPDMWAYCWKVQAEALLRRGFHIVADDVRFPNEVEAILSLNGDMWHVSRPDHISPNQSSHASEGALDNYYFDIHIQNDLFEDLEEKIAQALRSSSLRRGTAS